MLQSLRARAELYRQIRQYFHEQQVLEVDVPVLGVSTVTDPFLEPIESSYAGRPYYLQTSPEFFLKRLLADVPTSMYYLGKAFRAEETSRRHNPEFTMLEWYRVGFNDRELIADVVALLKVLAPNMSVTQCAYGELFERYFGVDPHRADTSTLMEIARQHIDFDWTDDNKATWLDLIFSHVIEPKLPKGVAVVYDYPECQCALAKIETDRQGRHVARRFEVFVDGVELANGYWELTDATLQRERFEADIALRSAMGLPSKEIDEAFMAAVERGIPECAGVALGVDRLLMSLEGRASIDAVIAFPLARL